MLTWKLWRALNRPPLRSPLFRRAYLRQGTPQSSDLDCAFRCWACSRT